ncbi:uncharacterized protein LOC123316415 [Coccinella septempunctata]|uniref:uncharacterized protein LOC123316415 n=1 Tax=Coccinella septempunctata TaxID=41139 RepID=UPI001D07F57B|nr:uncharacterized protein LOC123316415 [Coccinella septempunctata]
MENPSSETEVITLNTIFKKIINSDDGETEISLQVLNGIIETNLHLDLDNLDNVQRNALVYMLLRYIKNWPGWSKKDEYEKGSIDLDNWMLRFNNYICYKMQLLVTRTLPNIEKDLSDQAESSSVKTADVSTQTESKVNFSNFNIDLAGPATLLNNLVFSGHQGDIRVEEHAERPWVTLECADLLNYPYVQVEFNSPELSFKRSFEPKISQYLSCSSDITREDSNFILSKSSIHSNCSKWPIKISILETYISAFKAAVSSHLSPEQQEEVNIVLDQFYLDMVDVSTNNEVFENRLITFNIGRNIYKRTKKLSNGCSSPDVVFNEIFLPKVTSSFRYFAGMQHNSVEKIVADPDKIDVKVMLAFTPVITYRCTFCKITFSGPESRLALVSHLQMLHRRAQTLVCLRCNKCVEVAELSRRRWKCVCFEE